MTYEKIAYDNTIELGKLEGSLKTKKQNVGALKERVHRMNDRIETQNREREILEKNFEQIQREIHEYDDVLRENDSNVKRLELSVRDIVKVSARKQLENEVSTFKIGYLNSKL